jgi:nucleotide-binding universal stress UspA family protein
MLPPIVAGVDGSEESLAAAAWAAREAERRGRDLRLLHAWAQAPRRAGTPTAASRRHQAQGTLNRAEERVRRVCPGIRVHPDLVRGPATAVLLRATEQADLLVLGSRGLSGFTRILVGSVALGSAARSGRPVVLVRAGQETADDHPPAADGGAAPRTGGRDVVLGVDVATPCDEVIEFAFEEARLRHARLRTVYAWQQPPVLGLGPGEIALVDAPQRAEEWQGVLAAVLQVWREKYPEVDVVETVAAEKPTTALVRAASGARLLVVGRGPVEGPLAVRTGPVTHAAIHHAGCPVAVVPHE